MLMLIILITSVTIWFIQHYIKCRHLYKAARQRSGPLALPLIGSEFYFTGFTKDIIPTLLSFITNYEPPVPVWMGRRLCFLITDPKDLEVVLNHPNVLGKDSFYDFLIPTLGTGLFTAPVEKWKRNRKLMNVTFNQTILNGFVQTFFEQTEILCEKLQENLGKGFFDVYDYVSLCVLDIICETHMGVHVNVQRNNSDFVRWSLRSLEIASIRSCRVWLYNNFIFSLHPLSRELKKINKNIKDFTLKVLKKKREFHKKRMTNVNKNSDFENDTLKQTTLLDQLMESDKGNHFTDEELATEVKTFTVGGMDTSASELCFVFMMLGMFQDVQKKVYKEILDVLGFRTQVVFEDLPKLVYLERVIKETMRVLPVAAFISRDVTADIQLQNILLPKGSSAVPFILNVHRNPEIYPDPLKFNPDRFLPEEIAKRHRYSWLPFSAGPRNCIGVKYAFMLLKTVLATTIRKYKFTTNYTHLSEIDLTFEITMKPIGGYQIAVELRE